MIPTDDAIRAAVLAQTQDIARLFADMREESIDTSGEGVTRDTYGPGEQRAHDRIAALGTAMGLQVSRDHAANLYLTLPGRTRDLPSIMMGSHLDSVPKGGNFDGAAGVLAGLIAIRTLQSLGITPRADVTTMAIRAEESVWFQVSYVGSRSAFGTLPDGALDARRIDTGRSLAEHMADCGADVAAVRDRKAHLDPSAIGAFVEVHIEQAPQLVEAGLPVAIGTGVPGNFRYPYIRILGAYDHVGLPRRFRRDAVMAASDLALGLDRIWEVEDAAGRPMAFTTGRFHTDPKEHALTKIAGEMGLSLDVRAYEKAHLETLESALVQLVGDIEARRGVRIELGPRTAADVAPSDPALMAKLTQAAIASGVPTMPLASPASHDTATFAVAGVPACMLFVRNANGSHNPAEAMEIADFMQAAVVLSRWLVHEVTQPAN